MNLRALLSNLSVAFLAQGISFAISAVTALVVPKLLGVEEFGYWQLFLFYYSYAGFFHFGMDDGIYLLNGGKDRAEVDKPSIAAQFKLGIAVQTIIAIAIVCFGLLSGTEEQRVFALAATGVCMVLSNASGLLGFLFQAVNETKLYSASAIVDRLSFLVPLLALLIAHVDVFEPYVIAWCFSKACALAFCCWKGRDVLAARRLSLREACMHALSSVRVGIKLMLANIASMLVLGVLRFAIDAQWGIAVFGLVSFGLTMANFFLQFMSQVAMVLFPALRRADDDERRLFFKAEQDAFGLLLPAAYLFYVPMCWFLSIWLPQYEPSFLYCALLMPLCLFDGKMNMVSTTFFKVLRMEGTLLFVNACAVAVSSACVLVGVFVLENVEAAIMATVCVIASRSVISELMLMRLFDLKGFSVLIGEICVSVVFVGSAVLLGTTPGSFTCTVVGYAVHILVNRRKAAALLSAAKSAGLR